MADLSPNIYADLNQLKALQFKAVGFNFTPNQPINSVLTGKNVSKLRGRGLNFEELRHYRPGDDIRSMDWKVTRRTGKPHIKVYSEERERNVYLIIDQRRSMFFGSTEKTKSVIAAEIAALIAWQITSSGDRIGALIYNDEQVKIIPAKRGKQHVSSVLMELVKFNHLLKVDCLTAPTEQTLNNAFDKIAKMSAHNCLFITIGDNHGWNDKTTLLIKRLRQHNEIISCHICDPLEQDLIEMPQMVVSDGEQQIQFSSTDKTIQHKYRQSLIKQMSTFTKVAKKYRIPLLAIDTISPSDKQLRRLLGGVING